MAWLVSACCGFLLRYFFIRVVLIFNYKFSCVKKFNCAIVYSEIPLGRDSFSCGDRSVGEQWGLIDWFLYGAPYSIEGLFLMNLSESFIIYTPSNNMSDILWKKLRFIIFCIFLTLYLFSFVILLCLTKFESIKLKCYFTTLLYAITVNRLVLEFFSKKDFSFNYTFDAG